MRNKKIGAAITSFAIAFVSLAGGTFAWYVTSNTAQANIGGATIKTDHLKVGMLPYTQSGKAVAQTSISGGSGDEIDGYGSVYFPNATNVLDDSTTVLSASMIEKVYVADGYATGVNQTNNHVIHPITTGAFQSGDDLTMFDKVTELDYNPAATDAGGEDDYAPTAYYIRFKLMFATVGPEKSIYLNEALTTVASGNMSTQNQKDLVKSLRVGFSPVVIAGTNETIVTQPNRIYNPTANFLSTDVVETEVGGRLDLNGDGVWDYDDVTDISTNPTMMTYKERYYGQHTGGDITYTPFVEDLAATPAVERVIPIPGSNSNSWSAFGSVRNEDEVNMPSETLTFDPTAVTADVQESYGIKDFSANGGTPIVVSDANGYAAVEITIWLEGWDPNCDNDIQGETFSLGLGFVSPDQDYMR